MIDKLFIRADEILVYLRKSRSDDPSLSVEEVLAKHEEILDEWAIRNLGEKIPEENKLREVVSGETLSDRPEVQKLLKLIESPRYKAILAVEVQRLSRGDLEDAGKIIKIIRYTHTKVITPLKTYDLEDDYDRDFFKRELERGNDYLEYIKKIMHRGTLLSVSQGNYVGSVPPYGYDKIWVTENKRKCPTLAPNNDAPIVALIFDMYGNKGIGIGNICNHLESLHIKPPKGKHWAEASVRDMLINVHYIGKIKWDWRKTIKAVENGNIVSIRPKSKDYQIFDGKHEAIVSEELFDKVQVRMGKNARVKSSVKVRNPLASLIKCECGTAMTLRNHCDCRPRVTCRNQKHCHNGSCTYEELFNMVCKILADSIKDFEVELAEVNTQDLIYQEKLHENLKVKWQSLEEKELALWEAYYNPDQSQRMPSEIFKRLNEKILQEKEDIKQALNQLTDTKVEPYEVENRIVRFKDALSALKDESIDAEKKNILLKNCIESITYSRKAPQRLKRTPGEDHGTRFKTSGGHWEETPINLDVKLRL